MASRRRLSCALAFGLALLLPAAAEARPGAVVAFVEGAAAQDLSLIDRFAAQGMSVGLVSPLTGGWEPSQVPLDVSQGSRVATRLYDDGTPKTKHLTTNVRIDVDDAAGTASSTANYLVTQATPELPLQVIVTGHYRDTFHLVDGSWWFDTRTMYVDQIGDTSHHLKF